MKPNIVDGVRMGMGRWWAAGTDRGDTVRLEAFSDGVLAIAITLLILDVHVETPAGTSLAAALGHALPQIGAYAASFLQIGIMWANHHALFRVVDRVDPVLMLLNLALLGCVSFIPLPTRLVAEHTAGADARTAMLLYGGTLTVIALVFNLIWWYLHREGLLVAGLTSGFVRDVDIRYLLGLAAYTCATLVALVLPVLTVVIGVAVALMFVLGPSVRPTFVTAQGDTGGTAR